MRNLALPMNNGISIADAVSQVTVEPQSCICPKESYTCRAYAVTGMSWSTEVITGQISYIINSPFKENITRDDLQVYFVEDDNILLSQLFIVALDRLSGKYFTCAAFSDGGSETRKTCWAFYTKEDERLLVSDWALQIFLHQNSLMS